MPGLNQMGPDNMGPMTGRRMGSCMTGNAQNPTYSGQGYGRGYGQGSGYGRGRGCGRGFGPRGRGFGFQGAPAPWAQAAPVTKADLNMRAQALEQELEAVRNELNNLSQE